jgi:hypothetical protein
MQSTPSRARHSASILAPLIKVDIKFASEKSHWKTKKAISRFEFAPLMAFWNSVPAGLSGAGYDDQDANNNAYRNTAGDEVKGPGCESVEHRGLKFEFSLQV